MLRVLQKTDYKDYIELLSQLTEVGDITEEEFILKYNEIKSNFFHKIYVIVENDKVIGTGTLLIEPKFLHQCKNVGHIEDIVIHKDYRGKKYGKKILELLLSVADRYNCYKVILNCKESNKGFYEKMNFKFKEITMMNYFQ